MAASTASRSAPPLHCLTGCAIGEVLGMVIGTASAGRPRDDRAGGRAGVPVRLLASRRCRCCARAWRWARSIPIALASDTISIAVMEIVDNAIMLLIPGAMDAGLGTALLGSLAFALLIAGAVAFPVNRWLIARGKGHAVVHQHHAH